MFDKKRHKEDFFDRRQVCFMVSRDKGIFHVPFYISPCGQKRLFIDLLSGGYISYQ